MTALHFIHTLDELEAMDPDTILIHRRVRDGGNRDFIIEGNREGEAGHLQNAEDKSVFLPAAVIVPGEQVRTARRALADQEGLLHSLEDLDGLDPETMLTGHIPELDRHFIVQVGELMSRAQSGFDINDYFPVVMVATSEQVRAALREAKQSTSK